MLRFFSNKVKEHDFLKVFTNASYLTISQGVSYLIPLITLSYVISLLGLEKFGRYSVILITATLLQVVTDYGFMFISPKEISIAGDNKQRVSEVYISTTILKSLFLLLIFVFYTIVCYLIIDEYDLLINFLLGYLIVISQSLYPTWFFQGIQKMKIIAGLSIIAKIINCLLVIFFLKISAEINILILSQAFPMFVVSFYANLIIIKKYIYLVKPSWTSIRTLFLEGSGLFLANISSAILTNSTIPILSIYATPTQLGAYAAIERIIKSIYTIFFPISQAIYPYNCKRFSYSLSDGITAVKKTGIPMVVFALITSVSIVITFYVMRNYIDIYIYQYVLVVIFLSLWLIVGVINNVLGIQFLCAYNCKDFYSKAFFVSSSLTIPFMFWFSSWIPAIGTSFAVLMGESLLGVILFIKIYNINKRVKLSD
ncbi:oligosaccharide flippase family protein [Enterobacter hormaechei]|nr:oligosaccharide flippase family protein [Enterobacter hormaechei]